MIPPHVAAYAAGMLSVDDGHDRRAQAVRAAGTIKAIGLGDYDPDELRVAALQWLHDHVDASIVQEAVARLVDRRGGVQ